MSEKFPEKSKIFDKLIILSLRNKRKKMSKGEKKERN